jgi:hypothetical protein
MADEAQVRGSIEITNPTSGFKYRSYPTDFKADVTGSKGPTPGALTVVAAGTSIDLSELTTPGLCILKNLSLTVTVDVGISDGTEFYPLFEVQPGEVYPCRLSKWLGRSFGGTGTGSYDTDTYTMMIKPQTNVTCNVVVEAFEA